MFTNSTSFLYGSSRASRNGRQGLIISMLTRFDHCHSHPRHGWMDGGVAERHRRVRVDPRVQVGRQLVHVHLLDPIAGQSEQGRGHIPSGREPIAAAGITPGSESQRTRNVGAHVATFV
eukprot:1191495-Prorocentrum_minimum.AAC.2